MECNKQKLQGWLKQQFRVAGENGWHEAEGVLDKVERQLIGTDYYPRHENIFKALELIAPNEVKYLIMGMDPYPGCDKKTGEPDATGVAFDIPLHSNSQPPSLKNILNGLDSSGAIGWKDKLACFRQWYQSKEEGILLLNAALTVAAGTSGSHLKIWKGFIMKIVEVVVVNNKEAEYVAWGGYAGNLMRQAINGRREFTWACHPQPRGSNEDFSAFWHFSPVAQRLRDGYERYIAR